MNFRFSLPLVCLLALALAAAAPKGKDKDQGNGAGVGDKSKPEKMDKDKDKDAPADKPAAKTDKPLDDKAKVYRFKSEKKTKSPAGDVTVLQLEDAFTGKTETLNVTSDEAVAGDIRKLIEDGLPVGTPVEITTEKSKGRSVVTSMKKADVQPGEELPNGFVFVESKTEKKGGVDNIAVTLSKFGREIVAYEPMYKNNEYDNAKFEPDPKVDYVVRRLQSGEVVEATIKKQGNRPTITEIYGYRKPERGKYIGTKQVEFNGAEAAGFEIAGEDGTTVTFTLDGAEQTRNGKKVFMPKGDQVAMLKHIKKDMEVEVRYKLDGRTWMLRDIKPIATAKPDKTADKSDKKSKDKDKDKEAGDMKDDAKNKTAKAGDAKADAK